MESGRQFSLRHLSRFSEVVGRRKTTGPVTRTDTVSTLLLRRVLYSVRSRVHLLPSQAFVHVDDARSLARYVRPRLRGNLYKVREPLRPLNPSLTQVLVYSYFLRGFIHRETHGASERIGSL